MKTDYCLPHYMVVGGMKCGTTSVYEYLGKHPFIGHVKQHWDFFPDDIMELVDEQLRRFVKYKKVSREVPKSEVYVKPLLKERGWPEQYGLLIGPDVDNNKPVGPKSPRSQSSRIKRNYKTLEKLKRPIIGSKEIRWFGPSLFKFATFFADTFSEPFNWFIDCFPTV
eukprot:UN25636